MYFIKRALLAGAIALSGQAAQATPLCASFDDRVGPLKFEAMPASKVAEKLMTPMGYKVSIKSGTDVPLTGEVPIGSIKDAIQLLSDMSQLEFDVKACSMVMQAKGVKPEERVYALKRDEDIHKELEAWATSEEWNLVWALPHTWSVFANTSIRAASAVDAASKVVEYLRDEGKSLRLVVYQGNRVMEVVTSDIASK